MGKRFDKASVDTFTELFSKKVTGSLDRSYEILKNANRANEATKIAYPVSKQYMEEAKQLVRQVFTKTTGKEISEADLQKTINKKPMAKIMRH